MKKLWLILIAALLFGQAVPVTLPDVTGDGAAHRVSATSLRARTADLTALTTNTGNCRVGDANVSTTRGQLIAPGGSYHYEITQVQGYSGPNTTVELMSVYYNCPTGDKLSIHYVP